MDIKLNLKANGGKWMLENVRCKRCNSIGFKVKVDKSIQCVSLMCVGCNWETMYDFSFV